MSELLARRERFLGAGNPLFYDEPLHLVRGEGVWLFDNDGNRYLDCYNNVPCVGHCHPRVVSALCEQAGRLNTHTRYLDENIVNYAEKLLGKFDASLDRLALTCTGSEANDLAMRIARVNSGGDGFVCTNATYHGNTTAVAQLSSIFKPVGGYGKHVRRIDWPDSYRNEGDVTAEGVAQLEAAIAGFAADGIKFAGLLVCPIFANEGLPALPGDYLARLATVSRDAGGVFIADEVQSGFGRTGRWWGHDGSGMVPDIVTLGKPMAAGHPVAGVVSRGELLDNYRQQEMYFNTFGGNPVSCATATAVLDVLEDEDLVANAANVGDYVLGLFKQLQSRHHCIGDVRGRGLFFGIDLVSDRESKSPAPGIAANTVNSMRHNGVLMSKIGEHDNVLKLRPPLCFSKSDADFLVEKLDQVLDEVAVAA